MRSLDRHQVRVYRSHPEADDGGYMPATRAERLSRVWELTEDEWAFFGELMLNEATCLDARQACVRRQSWTAVTLWRLALLLGVAVALGGCVPMVEHYLRIEAPDGRYFNNTCHARLGPPSVVYYPYHGIFLSLDVTDWVSLGVHVPAGFSAQLDDDHVRISGITTGGSVDVSLRIIAAPQGDLGNRDPREFDGLPDPFSSPDHFGPLL